MRRFLLSAVAVLFAVASFSQTVLYQDDFESYTVGSYLAASSPDWWTTWSGAPGTGEDAIISDDYGHTPTKSALVDETGGATDLIFKMGNKTSGVYNVNFYVYIATGFAGYYNFQHFESPGIEWAFEVYFNTDGTGDVNAGATGSSTFTFPHDTWVYVENFIDLDNDWAILTIDGVEVQAWQFSLQASGGAGTKQLGGIDFFAGAQGSDNPAYYLDDMIFEILPTALYEDDFESYAVDDYIAVQNPTWWTTWSNAPGTGEDGIIKNTYSHSPTKSVMVDEADGATDLILKLGDKVSGSYVVDWYMYVPANYAGYYNFQHFESPGIEWALELYFNTDGTADLSAGGTNIATFNYNHGEWFLCHHVIDLDADWAEIWVDGVLIHEWQWSLQADGTAGTNQLGGVDFFAGAAGSDNPLYYFDDLSYVQAAANQDPIITVNPLELSATAPSGSTATVPLTITNDGASDLNYEIIAIYDMPVAKSATSISGNATPVKSLNYGASIDPNARPAAYNPPPADDAVLNYDGDNYSAIGWTTDNPISPTAAAMFPASITNQYIGMTLTSVDIYINDETGQGTGFYLRIYDMGNSYEPGTLLVEQAFTPMTMSWNNVVLDNPVYITGADIWVGYKFTQPASNPGSIFIPGTDAGPNDPNGDFISTGVGWSHLSNNPDLPYNWNIRANLTGDPMPGWLSFAPTSGSVAPGESATVNVNFDAMGVDPGTYTAIARIVCNDPETPQLDVPVTFEVTAGGTMQSVILDFEDIEDFSLTFNDWTAVDNDGAATYGFTDIVFPHNYEPMAFICFNPANTEPTMSGDAEIQPHGGARFGACFASVPPPYNDDWLISPQITLGTNSSINMWVKSYTDEYGLEKYNVAVSTTGMDPADFTVINSPSPMEAPMAWTEVNYDLSAYDLQTVYVAIQCVSTDAFVFMVDDVSIDFLVGTPEMPANEARISIFPNPAHDYIHITSSEEMSQVEILNQLGQKVYSQTSRTNTCDLSTTGFENGIYYVRITTAQGTSVQKLMIK
jgi:hypothetical protein